MAVKYWCKWSTAIARPTTFSFHNLIEKRIEEAIRSLYPLQNASDEGRSGMIAMAVIEDWVWMIDSSLSGSDGSAKN